MTSAMFHVLVVEDDAGLCTVLDTLLAAEGHRVSIAGTAARALIEARSHRPDLILLDLGLPDRDGQALIAQIRAFSQVPLVVLSARDQESERIAALDAGADDYVTKPFGVGELMARLRVALRHRSAAGETDASSQFEHADLRIDFAARTVTVAGSPVHLTPNEYRVLTVLVRNAGKVVTHQHLLREVWGPSAQAESHYLRVYVNQLREKLSDDPSKPRYIKTEVGVGYRFDA